MHVLLIDRDPLASISRPPTQLPHCNKPPCIAVCVDIILSEMKMSSTWLSAAFNEIQQSPDLNNDLYDILRAFGKDDDDAPGPANLDPDALLYADVTMPAGYGNGNDTTDDIDTIAHLQNRIATELLDEIDADQAKMFSRRFVSVSSLLKEEKDKEAVTSKQLLRLALHRRTVQILSTSDPILSQRKALRIRALVDFIWSLSLVLSLKDSPTNDQYPTLSELANKQGMQSTSNQFHTGFYHSTIEGVTSDFGPVHINILRINLVTTSNNNPTSSSSSSSGCRMKCMDARDICTDLPTLAQQMGAVAAISGGFFLYSEPDIELPSKRTDPVGLLVEDGKVNRPPVFQRSAILQNRGGGSIDLDKVGMDGVTCTFFIGNRSTSFDLTIGNHDGVHVRCIHRGDAEEAIVESGHYAFAIVGDTVVQRKIGGVATEIPVPLAGFVIIFPEKEISPDTKIIHDHDVEISVDYELPSSYGCVESAISGGPMFFSEEEGYDSMDLPSEDFKGSAPPVTFSQDETHDHNLLPRMGVGLAKCPTSGCEQLVCAAVDGRNLDRALGLTLQGTSNLLRSLGCYKAMNLDGGSSKRMVIWDPAYKKHKVVCLSTTEIKAKANSGKGGSKCTAAEPSRPVHSAILFLPGEQ